MAEHLILLASHLKTNEDILRHLRNVRIYQKEKDSMKWLPYLLELKRTLK